MNELSKLEKGLEKFKKSVDTSFAGPTPNSLLARQDLEAAIVVLSDRQTPFRDKVTRVRGEGRAHLWNQRRSLGSIADGPSALVSLFYSDGDIPAETDPTYLQVTAAYKFLGTTAVITGPMIASGRSYMDIEAEIAEAALRRIVQAEEWQIFHANSSINTKGFDGLDVQIVTNIVDNAGAALTATGVNIAPIDKIIKLVRLQGSSMMSGLFVSFGIQSIINQIVSPAARYLIDVGANKGADQVQAGLFATSYMSALGPVPVVGDFFCNPAIPYPYNASGSSGVTGGPVSTIYGLRTDSQGIEMVDLVALGRTELAKIADTVRFYINEYTVVAVKGEPWIGAVINVSDPA